MSCSHGKTNSCNGAAVKNNLCEKHICKEDNCDERVNAKNLCKKHYNKFMNQKFKEKRKNQKKEYNTTPEAKTNTKKWNKNNYERRKVEEPEKLEEEKYGEVVNLRNQIFLEYSQNTGLCSCCHEECRFTWDLDHADGSGNESRKKIFGDPWYRDLRKNDFPHKDNLTVMCCNCNQSKQYVGHVSSDHTLTKYSRNLQRGPKKWWKHKPREHKYKLESITAYCKNTKKKFRTLFQPKRLSYEKWLNSPSGKYVTSVLGKDLCCDWCGETWFDFLSLNHVDGGGNKDREEKLPQGKSLYSHLRARDFPDIDKWNVLCFNCQRLDKKTREKTGNKQIQDELF
jgi:hypothetical protein